MLTSHRSTIAALLAAPALLLALAACTSAASSGDTDAAKSSTSPSASPLSGDAYTTAYHEYELELAQCFRDQGLDVADPAPDGYLAADAPELQAAFPACSEKIGDPPIREITQQERVEALEANLKRATCLREKGYDVVEPTLEDPGFVGAEVTAEDFEACDFS